MTFERLRRAILGGLVAIALFGPAPPASAQEKAEEPVSLRIAVVNLQRIRGEGLVYKSIHDQIDKYRQSLQGVIKAEEDELRKADAELARKRTILSPEAFAQERRSFEKRVVEFQRQGQKRQQGLERVQQDALRKAEGEVMKIVHDFTVEHKLTIVMRAEMALFYASGLDITDIVLERLNAKVPNIKITKPEE
jgi:Skp family chaperone for outer membrane proteins